MLTGTDKPHLLHLQLGEGGYAFVYLVREAAIEGGASAPPESTATTYGGAKPEMFAVKRVSRCGRERAFAILHHRGTDQALELS